MTAKIDGLRLGPANGTKINYYDECQALVDNTDHCGVGHQQRSCTRIMRSSVKKLWKPISQKLWISGCSNLDFWIVLFTTGNEIKDFSKLLFHSFRLKFPVQDALHFHFFEGFKISLWNHAHRFPLEKLYRFHVWNLKIRQFLAEICYVTGSISIEGLLGWIYDVIYGFVTMRGIWKTHEYLSSMLITKLFHYCHLTWEIHHQKYT